MEIKVSVIIPVYNAEPYVRQAVQSALDQPETAEVILIDDCSPDKSWDVCLRMASEDSRVRLAKHPDGENHGAGESRNLGIRNAKCDFIAFLDADDYYLPHRFQETKRVFAEDPKVEGVYEAVGTQFESPEAKIRFFERSTTELSTLTEFISPDALFEALITGESGHFHTDGVVVRRTVFEKTGYFSPTLRQSQDTEMWLRLAAKCRLVGGVLNRPVAVRRVHNKNRSFGAPLRFWRYHVQLFESLWRWSRTEDLSLNRKALILTRWISAEKQYLSKCEKTDILNSQLRIFVKSLLQEPRLLTNPVILKFMLGFLIKKTLVPE